MFNLIRNVSQALELATQYEAINEDEISETANDLFGEGIYYSWSITLSQAIIGGGQVLRRLTGFGNAETCKLCKAVSKIESKVKSELRHGFEFTALTPACEECIYRLALGMNEAREGYYCTHAKEKTVWGESVAKTYQRIVRFPLELKLKRSKKSSLDEVVAVTNAIQLRDLIRFRAQQIREIIKYGGENA